MPSEHSYSSGFTLLSKRKEGGPTVNIRSTIRQLQAYQQSNASYVPQLAETVQSVNESQMEHRLRAVAMANYKPQIKEPAEAQQHVYNRQQNGGHQYTSYTDAQNFSRPVHKKPTVVYNSKVPVRGSRPAPQQRSYNTPPKAQRSPRAVSPMRNASVLLDRDGLISTTERTRFRGEVTKNLMDFFDETDELYECRENMRRQIFDAMRADPRHAKEMSGDVKLARRPTKEQLEALSTVETTLAVLREATMELVATYLTPEEKRHLGINTHQFQSRSEKRSAYQYVNDDKRVRTNERSSRTSARTSSQGYSKEKGAVETPVSPGDEYLEHTDNSPEQTEEPHRSTATTEVADSPYERRSEAETAKLASSTSPPTLPRQPVASPAAPYRPSVPSSIPPPVQQPVATSLFTPSAAARMPNLAPPSQSYAPLIPPVTTTTTTTTAAVQPEEPEEPEEEAPPAAADPYGGAASGTEPEGSVDRHTPERMQGPAPSVSTLDDGNRSLSSQGSPAARAPRPPSSAGGGDDMDIPVPTSQPPSQLPATTAPQGVGPRKVPPAFAFLFKKLPGGQMVKVAPEAPPGAAPTSTSPPASQPNSTAARAATPKKEEPTVPVRNEFKRFVIDSDSDSSMY